jgi:hypothetical protein
MRLATVRANDRCQVGRVTGDGRAVEVIDPGSAPENTVEPREAAA